MTTLALDIGGANLKAVHSDGRALSRPFALWQQPDKLTAQLQALIGLMPAHDDLAVTMTAELCDCFETKRQGVVHVLDSVVAAAPGRPVRIWQTTGRFVTIEQARDDPLPSAAANWHALATYIASLHPQGTCLLIDTGSTTTDIIRLVEGRVAATGLTDTDRLASGELLYLGVGRTPVMALGTDVPWRGRRFGVMAEHFAVTADLFLIKGDLPEQPENKDTPDGRPMTRAHAAARLLRMIGADLDMYSIDDAAELAGAFCQLMYRRIDAAIGRVARSAAERIIIAGSGAFLARRAAANAYPRCTIIDLADTIGPAASTAACAFALTQLQP